MPALPKFSLKRILNSEIDVAQLEGRRLHRPIAVLLIAILSAAVSIIFSLLPITRDGVRLADNVFYDWFYRHRPRESQLNREIVLVEIDDASLEEVDKLLGVGWPWPRLSYHMITKYLEEAGARAVAFDITLGERSASGIEDDEELGTRMDETKMPIAFARLVNPDGQWAPFKPNIRRPIEFGFVDDLSSDKVYRDYLPVTFDKPALALATLKTLNIQPKLPIDRPFLLHYYGPHRDIKDQPTFPAFKASRVIEAVNYPDRENLSVTPEMFKDKIVVVGATAADLHDVKAAPNARLMPGCEIQATAIANLMRGQAVNVMPIGLSYSLALVAGLIVAATTVLLRNALFKFLSLMLLLTIVIGGRFILFNSFATIYWSAISVPLMTILFAAIGGICWSYFLEDRQARRLLKALETCLSPSVAAELAKNPRKLATGGREMDMTVMFTDLADFSAVTEELKEKIEVPLNYYFGEMSEQLILENGTLDKYIGDAILTFWNAPIDQPEHPRFACRAALRILQRENEIREKMAELGVPYLHTRIGINTGRIIVGFMGSERKLNYTVIGDAVNTAARLEPANKLYGTRILVSSHTMERVKHLFLFRRIDLLQVKGKTEVLPIYELMGDESMKNTERATLARRFEEAFDLYRKQNWDAAERIWLELLEKFPEDGPCKTFLKRIEEFRASPPPTDWDGVYVAKTK